MKIVNWYYIANNKKMWYTTFADAILGMSLNHPMLWKLTEKPETLVVKHITEFKNINV